MSIVETSEQPAAPKPAKGKTRRRRKAAKPRAAATAAPAPKKVSQFAGMTATACAEGCTAGTCVVSTVGVCKHPYKTGDSGCGPVTLANREKARDYLKRNGLHR